MHTFICKIYFIFIKLKTQYCDIYYCISDNYKLIVHGCAFKLGPHCFTLKILVLAALMFALFDFRRLNYNLIATIVASILTLKYNNVSVK